ncbi:D-alanine--D-alanine ligase family protein [Paenibacillus ginsengarvi]|uniref:D-alanine--D-alanine ligase n=1 Tax=Paenibacillus ginsengarvi TaxID=400777 RepID=A0A3B0AMZ4_9BACL|nr:D-alanine--D-alanine ligase family protein [Paenibacillus ginsengarvi]RKN61988.1 D-alanine--D-alanine ligase [Paenibacillus ginsengarvi]
MRTNVYVMYGGQSPEHDVSLKSALAVINRLDRERYRVFPIYIDPEGRWRGGDELIGEVEHSHNIRFSVDEAAPMSGILKQWYNEDRGSHVVFPVLHGPNGEDGTLQGMLDMLNVPYVGNGVFASAAGMDKIMTKRLMEQAGIPQAPYMAINSFEWNENEEAIIREIEESIGYPCFVKPASMGSSIGINRCENRLQLAHAVQDAFRYDRKIAVEQEIDGREIQLAILGWNELFCSEAGEFERERNFFSYERKYGSGKLTMRIPARLDEGVYIRLRTMALRAFRTLDGAGLMRVDFFVTDDNVIYLNEVNTLPGFTENSMFPAMLTFDGQRTFEGLLDELIEFAFQRYQAKQIWFEGRVEA